MDYSQLILPVREESSEVLKKHTVGPGKRFVFSDQENNPNGNIYAITRVVESVDNTEPHFEDHTHDVASLWLFEGANPDLSGLRVEVKLGDEKFILNSPASIYIPAGVNHNYRFISSGRYTNIVLAKGGDYNAHIK